MSLALELGQQTLPRVLSVWSNLLSPANAILKFLPSIIAFYFIFFNDIVFQSSLLFLLFLWQDNFLALSHRSGQFPFNFQASFSRRGLTS